MAKERDGVAVAANSPFQTWQDMITFARANPAPPDGQGLNPLLQDPGLAFHPPTLYLGYVGLSAAFSYNVQYE